MKNVEKGPKIEKPVKSKEKTVEEKNRERRAQARFTIKTVGFHERYEEDLGVPISKEVLGETVLDLGAGYSTDFSRYAAKKGIKVHSLSESFSDERYRKLLKEHVGKKSKKKFPFVAGLAQELPFKSNSFDSVLSLWAIPAYLETSKEEYEAAFKEIVRVLRPGRRAYLGPVKAKEGIEIIEKLKKEFKKEKFADIKLERNNTIIMSKPKEAIED